MSTDRLLVTKSFDQLFEDGTKLVTRLKQINDSLQSEEPEDVEYINKKLQDSRTQFMSTSNQFKDMLKTLEQKAIGFDQKKKFKSLKDNFQKEVGRNKTISETLINWLYENNKGAMLQIRRQSIARKQTERGRMMNSSKNPNSAEQEDFEKQLQSVIPQENIFLDKLLIEERNDELAALAKDAEELNRIVKDVNLEVMKQDNELDIVVENQTTTKANLVETSKQLQEASTEQQYTEYYNMCRKTGKKILMYSLIALVCAGIIVGIVFLAK